MEYQEILQNIGLTRGEADVYLAALQLGKALPSALATKAGVKRPTLYKHLPRLKSLGLLSETVIGKRRYLLAEDPESYLKRKQGELEQFEEAAPGLRLLLNTVSIKPKIVFYEGLGGLRKLYMELLREKKPMLEFVSMDKIHPEIEFHARNYLIPQRIKRGIPAKIIVSGKTKSKLLNLRSAPYELRQVRVVDPEKYPIPLDSYVWGNNVAFMLYRTDSEPVGILIHSIEVATLMRSLFEIVWGAATPVPEE